MNDEYTICRNYIFFPFLQKRQSFANELRQLLTSECVLIFWGRVAEKKRIVTYESYLTGLTE